VGGGQHMALVAAKVDSDSRTRQPSWLLGTRCCAPRRSPDAGGLPELAPPAARSYGGTHRLLNQVRARTSGFKIIKADLSDPAAAKAAILGTAGARPAMVWVETPTNPTLKLADISAVAELARQAGALCVVDNTFATPALTRWVAFGWLWTAPGCVLQQRPASAGPGSN
jgi:cystathionine beta-lyase/cystathionine gamma-synthase